MLLCYDQVMSQSVSSAIHFTCGPQAFETAYFIEKIDKFFDCFNVSSYCILLEKERGNHFNSLTAVPMTSD